METNNARKGRVYAQQSSVESLFLYNVVLQPCMQHWRYAKCYKLWRDDLKCGMCEDSVQTQHQCIQRLSSCGCWCPRRSRSHSSDSETITLVLWIAVVSEFPQVLYACCLCRDDASLACCAVSWESHIEAGFWSSLPIFTIAWRTKMES